MATLLAEEEVYHIVEEGLRSEGIDVLKLAELARRLGLMCIEKTAKELAKDGRPLTDEERGKALWELLKEAIDGLKPLEPLAKPLTPEWHPYAILYQEYIIGTPNQDIAADLFLSRREFLRRRRTAIKRVVRQLMQWG